MLINVTDAEAAAFLSVVANLADSSLDLLGLASKFRSASLAAGEGLVSLRSYSQMRI